MSSSAPYYLKGSPLNVRLNSVIGWLARHGVSLAGTAELSVKGRKSGAMQRVPVNPHTHEGGQYLVSARGHSQWVRNMRAANGGELRVDEDAGALLGSDVGLVDRGHAGSLSTHCVGCRDLGLTRPDRTVGSRGMYYPRRLGRADAESSHGPLRRRISASW